MNIELDIPEYDEEKGMRLDWDDGFEITLNVIGEQAVLVGNPAGLRSLARHLLVLAQDKVPSGFHIHLDESNALEDGPAKLILQKQ